MSLKFAYRETIAERQAHMARAGAIYLAIIAIIFVATYFIATRIPTESAVVKIRQDQELFVKRCISHGFFGRQSRVAGPAVGTIAEAQAQSCDTMR